VFFPRHRQSPSRDNDAGTIISQFAAPLGGVLGGGEILHSGDHDGREGTRVNDNIANK